MPLMEGCRRFSRPSRRIPPQDLHDRIPAAATRPPPDKYLAAPIRRFGNSQPHCLVSLDLGVLPGLESDALQRRLAEPPELVVDGHETVADLFNGFLRLPRHFGRLESGSFCSFDPRLPSALTPPDIVCDRV